ncbi:MAG: hypothetical protein Q9169_006606 [Polycauliona sp. 2 TL-2023]
MTNERPSTPPRPSAATNTTLPLGSPLTPEQIKHIEINRLKAKALRGQREADSRDQDGPPSFKHSDSNSGIVTGQKRAHAAISTSNVPATLRDGRSKVPAQNGGFRPLDDIQPARNFTKYVEYDFSKMTDTKGGFLTAEDDPHNKALHAPDAGDKPSHMTLKEWERHQLLRSLRNRKEGPFEPGLSVLKKEDNKMCRECQSLEIDWKWEDVFGCAICNTCKDKFPEKYSLLTKTEAREDYLLTDPELKDEELLPHLERPNPHKATFHNMMLFLRYQVEEYAFGKKWGSAEALDEEFARREKDKKRRKEDKFKSKLQELKKKTRVDAHRRNRKAGVGTGAFGDDMGNGGKHTHTWGRAVENDEGIGGRILVVRSCIDLHRSGTSELAIDQFSVRSFPSDRARANHRIGGHTATTQERGPAPLMAWQNSAAMVGNGGGSSGPSEAGGSNGQIQGTEYTLQGVMRFLQTEWHRHERDRNAWQIERAEMKSRIGKLEGDGRTSKRLQESLGKHVRLLENALKKEREKVKALSSGQASEEKRSAAQSPKEGVKPGLKPELSKPRNSFLDTEHDADRPGGLKQDSERDKSRLYLGKCVQEVTYHVVPTSANQRYLEEQEQLVPNHHFTGSQQQHQQPSLEEVYVQQRQKQQQGSLGVLGPSPIPNHVPPPTSRTSDVLPSPRISQPPEQPSFMTRSLSLSERQPQHQNPPLTAINTRQSPHASYGFPSNEDQIETVSHSYDSYGRPIQPREEEETQRISEEPENADPDHWNFDEPPEPAVAEERSQQEFMPPQRPDTDAFPAANNMGMKSPTRGGLGSHRRKSSLSRRRQSDGSHELRELSASQSTGNVKGEAGPFKVRFALRGHLDVVRSVIFTGGGSPSEPEICTSGDDGVIKRWIIPASYGNYGAQGGGAATASSNDLDVQSYFTHRGHSGAVMSLAASPASQNISNGGRAPGDGWVFSGGQDATVRVWERGRVDAKATLDGHTDAVWTVCVLPGSSASVFGEQAANHGGPERVVLASGAADGTILIWAVSTPPHPSLPHTSSRRGPGGSRRANSVSSGSNFPSSPQPSTATARPFHYSLVHRIERADHPSPTCISPLSINGDTFVVSFADASVLIYGTRTGEEMVGMASLETYDGSPGTGVNAIAATTVGLDGTLSLDSGRGVSEDEALVHGPTGSSSGVEGVVLSGHEDRYIRFFDANSGQCTYNMLAHPSAISSLSLSPSGAELVSGGHDASLRFWSLEKRACTQEITSLRIMRGEGVCSVAWSADGRWVVGAGGEGVVKVFGR